MGRLARRRPPEDQSLVSQPDPGSPTEFLHGPFFFHGPGPGSGSIRSVVQEGGVALDLGHRIRAHLRLPRRAGSHRRIPLLPVARAGPGHDRSRPGRRTESPAGVRHDVVGRLHGGLHRRVPVPHDEFAGPVAAPRPAVRDRDGRAAPGLAGLRRGDVRRDLAARPLAERRPPRVVGASAPGW